MRWPGSKPPGTYTKSPTKRPTVTITETTTITPPYSSSKTRKPWTSKVPVTTTIDEDEDPYYAPTTYSPVIIEATATLPAITLRDGNIDARSPQTWTPVATLPTTTEDGDNEWVWPWWTRSTATPVATPRPTGIVTVCLPYLNFPLSFVSIIFALCFRL
jgi:hypothetical protein